MTRTIRMKYGATVNNMGDQLNTLIPRDLFGVDIKNVNNIYESETTGIGSYLEDYFISVEKLEMRQRIKQKMKKIRYLPVKSPTVRFWSTGFMRYPKGDEISIRPIKDLRFSSVRGELSKKRLESIMGSKLDITTGDAGLLANRLVTVKEKKYLIGIIPHFREQDEKIFKKAKEFYPNSTWINLMNNPYDVIRQIGECEFIISSSLHGLIVADSFGIPNIRVIKSNKLFGDGYKFDDYYSSFGLNPKKVLLSDDIKSLPSISYIADNYVVNSDDVARKQVQICEAFYKNI
ncbi:polysaccharide pyruvyl transferase family protein [Lapidilactobacillus dextrinicus]|uniref:polysaccharide pyruvyl transferase family protein n=1 Tax=Lapidilactobacillus dextrinicus TaxID=51664 RepID=UPI003F25F37D